MGSDFNQQIIAQFRSTSGAAAGPGNTKLLLLTTTGARSGERRTMPLAYSKDGDRYVIVASKGGAPTNPAWYHNLVRNPEVEVEVGPQKFSARAIVTKDDERERLLRQHFELMPQFQDYVSKTTRVLPVIALERAG